VRLRVDWSTLLERWALPVLLAVSLAHGCAYAFMVPPWQAPDEPGHFEHSRLLADRWVLADGIEPDPELELEIVASLYDNRYWDYVPHPRPDQMPSTLAGLNTFAGQSRTLNRPSLSYLPYALLLWPVRHQDVELQLLVLRLASVLLLPAMVWMGWRAARLLLPDDVGPAVVAGSFLALLPQQAHLTASVSDGNLTGVLAAGYFVALAAAARWGVTVRRAVVMGLLALLALLSKNTALFLVPVTLLALVALARRHGSRRNWWIGAGSAVALLVVGLRFAPRSVHLESLLGRWTVAFSADAYQPERLENYQLWSSMTFESFWGRFGWMNVRMADAAYAVLGVASVALVIGLVARLLLPGPVSRLRQGSRSGLLLYAAAVLLSLSFIVGTWVVYYSPAGNFSQGRYLFPVLVPLAVLAGYGSGASVTERRGRAVLAVVVLAMVALAAHALFGTVAGTFV